MIERLKDARALAAATLAAMGGIGITGCGTDVNFGHAPSGVYGKNMYVYPNDAASRRLEVSCKGSDLLIKEVNSWTHTSTITARDRMHIWVDDAACEDGKLTTDDNIQAELLKVKTF